MYELYSFSISKFRYAALILISLFLPLLSQAAVASKPVNSQQHRPMQNALNGQDDGWLVQGGLGSGQYVDPTNHDRFRISSFEVDSLAEHSKPAYLYFYLGAQYIHHLHFGPRFNWLSAFGVGPSIYYQPGNFYGEVYQFQLPSLNNYFYKYKVNPINVYLEADLYFHPLFNHRVTPYIFVGGGSNVVRMSYGEVVTPAAAALGVPASSAIGRQSEWQGLVAYEVGAGFNVALPDNMFVALRYVFQDSVTGELSVTGAVTPLKVSLMNNSGYILLGYHF